MELYGYNPLKNIIFADDFDTGYNGWITLMPNFRQDKMDYYDSFRNWTQWGPPMLSSATFPYAGTHGSMHGTYSMKIATRPVAGKPYEKPISGSEGMAIKRLTRGDWNLLKCEMYFAFTAEQNIPGIGENAIRAFGFFWDTATDYSRTMYGARYLNSAGGRMQQRWQLFKVDEDDNRPWGFNGVSAPGDNGEKVSLVKGIDYQWLGARDENGNSNGYYNLPNGEQKFCYNETPDKINWQYFALTVDLEEGEYVSLECVTKKWDLRGIKATKVGRYPRIDWILNPVFFIESDTDRRVFLYVDSVVNSWQ